MGEAEGGAEVFAEVDPVFFWDGGEDFDHFGVELRAGAAANFFASVAHWQGFAVGAVADHGVERISDGENAGAEGDLIAFEAAGVAAPVEEFLVSEDDFGGITQERDADEHVVADFAVRAHDLLFIVGEGPRFAENAVGDGHFADVVEESGACENGQIVSWNGHGFGDGDGEGSDALAMTFGFGVLQVERATEGFQCVVVRLFELSERDSELPGALFDLMLELELVAAVFRDEAAMLKSAADAEEELVFFEGLEDVVVSAATDGFESRGNVVDGGDHDDRDLGVVFTEPIEQLDAVHLGHDHVAQDKIRRGLFDLLLGSAAIAYGRAAITFRFEHGGNDFSNRFFIVDDQYLF